MGTTSVDINALAAAITAAVQSAMNGGGGGGGTGVSVGKPRREELDWRLLNDVDKYAGGEAGWTEWKFKFLNAVGAVNLHV